MKTFLAMVIAACIFTIGVFSLMLAGAVIVADTENNNEIAYRILLNIGLISLGIPAFLYYGKALEKLFTKRKNRKYESKSK